MNSSFSSSISCNSACFSLSRSTYFLFPKLNFNFHDFHFFSRPMMSDFYSSSVISHFLQLQASCRSQNKNFLCKELLFLFRTFLLASAKMQLLDNKDSNLVLFPFNRTAVPRVLKLTRQCTRHQQLTAVKLQACSLSSFSFGQTQEFPT